MNLNVAKFITLLITAGLLVVATLVDAEENVQPSLDNPIQAIFEQVLP